MFSNYVPVRIEVMFNIHARMRELKALKDEMAEPELDFWMFWEESYLYDEVMERFEVALARLTEFTNDEQSGCTGEDKNELEFSIFRFTTLTHSLNRCLTVLGLDAIRDSDYHGRYQEFLELFKRFHEIASSLQDNLGIH